MYVTQVEQMARKLALVPEEGASLPVYLLSYLQSFLLVTAVSPIPKSELDDQPIDAAALDTYDVLQRARCVSCLLFSARLQCTRVEKSTVRNARRVPRIQRRRPIDEHLRETRCSRSFCVALQVGYRCPTRACQILNSIGR